jgi:hypothetical protein
MIFTFIFAIWVCKEEVEDYHVNGFFASWYFLFSFSISVFFFFYIFWDLSFFVCLLISCFCCVMFVLLCVSWVLYNSVSLCMSWMEVEF